MPVITAHRFVFDFRNPFRNADDTKGLILHFFISPCKIVGRAKCLSIFLVLGPNLFILLMEGRLRSGRLEVQ